jgi:hypothetical protein
MPVRDITGNEDASIEEAIQDQNITHLQINSNLILDLNEIREKRKPATERDLTRRSTAQNIATVFTSNILQKKDIDGNCCLVSKSGGTLTVLQILHPSPCT